MVNVAIVEDERGAMEVIESYLLRYSKEKQEEFHSVWFDNPINFLTNYNMNYELVLLDIELPDMNGMDVARKMREMDSTVTLIFVTNMAQYAISGYEVDADDFVVKPVSYHDFALKLERVLKKIKKKDDAKIILNYDGEVKFMPAKNVRFIEVIKHKLIYHTLDGNFEMRGSLKKIAPMLLENGFAKCNNYCLVNLRYVSGVKGYTLFVSFGGLQDGQDEILISHPRKKDFARALNDYLGEKV